MKHIDAYLNIRSLKDYETFLIARGWNTNMAVSWQADSYGDELTKILLEAAGYQDFNFHTLLFNHHQNSFKVLFTKFMMEYPKVRKAYENGYYRMIQTAFFYGNRKNIIDTFDDEGEIDVPDYAKEYIKSFTTIGDIEKAKLILKKYAKTEKDFKDYVNMMDYIYAERTFRPSGRYEYKRKLNLNVTTSKRLKSILNSKKFTITSLTTYLKQLELYEAILPNVAINYIYEIIRANKALNREPDFTKSLKLNYDLSVRDAFELTDFCAQFNP